MDTNGACPGCFHPPGKLHRIDVLAVEAGTKLDRDRFFHRLDDLFHQCLRIGRLPHQCTAGLCLDDLVDRTAHVDINDVAIALLIQQFCGIDHAFDVVPEDLQAHRMFIFHDPGHVQRLSILVIQRLVADHLRTDQTGAEPFADAAKGDVGNTGHRCDHQRVGDLYIADLPASLSGML